MFVVHVLYSAKGKSKLWVIGSFHVFAKQMVLTGKLQSHVDLLRGVPSIFNFPLCLYQQKQRKLSNPPELLFLGQVVILGKHSPVAARHNAGKA